MDVLIIPPNDLLRHPIPNRLYHIGKRLARKHNIYLLSYPGHPIAGQRKIRYMNCSEVSFRPLICTNNLGFYYVANTLHIKKAITALVAKVNIDLIIHANILPSYITLKIAQDQGIPSIYDYLDHFPESASMYYVNRFIRKLSYGFVFWLVRQNLKMSTHIVTVSRTLHNFILRFVRNKGKVTVIPNGVDSELFKPIPTKIARKKIGLIGYDYILLYYGSVDMWLDLEVLLKVVNDLQRMMGKIVLVILGISHNVAIRSRLNDFIIKHNLHKNVLFLPAQPYEKIPLYVNASDIILAPYKKVAKNYVTPLKILEALACAKPVITSDISEFKLWFHDMPVNFYQNANEIKKIIISLLRSYDTYKQELNRASKEIRSRFSWDKIADIYEELMKSLC